jgi:hypothetical protein
MADDKLIELTEAQQNPGLARAEDFEVIDGGAPMAEPFHGQHGDSRAEYKRLLAQRDQDGKSKPGSARPDRPDVDHHAKPHTMTDEE